MSTKTGTINKLIVYNGTVQVGFGYVIIDERGIVHSPNVFDDDGKDLPRNQWYNIVATGEQKLIVLTRRIQ